MKITSLLVLMAGLTYVQALPESDMDHEIDFDFSNEDDQDFIPDNHSGKDEAEEDYDEL